MEQANVRTMLVAGRHEEAADSACQLFDDCREAGMQVTVHACQHCSMYIAVVSVSAVHTGLIARPVASCRPTCRMYMMY